jgi:hypothetical protein
MRLARWQTLRATATGLLLAFAALPDVVISQMCPATLRRGSATDVLVDMEWVGGVPNWRGPTLGVRWVGSVMWASAFGGRTESNRSFSVTEYDPNDQQSYSGIVEYQFLGAGAALGWHTRTESSTLCFSASGTYSWQWRLEIDGGFPPGVRASLESRETTTSWSTMDEISVDRRMGRRAAVGIGAFLRHSALNLQGPRGSETDGGGSLGFGALLGSHLLVSAKLHRATGSGWWDFSGAWRL